jgi:hypothetical protein
MLAALAADTARHIRRVRAVIEILSAGCCKGDLQLRRPLLVSFSESPDLVGGQVEITEYRSERLAAVDRVQELLP